MITDLPGFWGVIKHQPHVRNGVFPSELFLFLRHCAEAKVGLLIESGVRNGYSTRVLGAAAGIEMISIDRDDCSAVVHAPGRFVRGDARVVVPEIIAATPADVGVAVLLDGPKHDEALALKDACLAAGARVVAIHDLAAGRGETAHSHAPDFRNKAWVLDRAVAREYQSKYPQGPGLAVWRAAA